MCALTNFVVSSVRGLLYDREAVGAQAGAVDGKILDRRVWPLNAQAAAMSIVHKARLVSGNCRGNVHIMVFDIMVIGHLNSFSHTVQYRQLFCKGPFTPKLSVNTATFCDNAGDSVLIKTMELLENGLQLQCGATSLSSRRTELLVLSQSCRNIDAEAWYEWALSGFSYRFDIMCKQQQMTVLNPF